MNPEPLTCSQMFSIVSIVLWLFAILAVADVILKLWLLRLKRRASELDAEIRELDTEIRELAKERLRAKNAASDDSYWFDPEGHSHFCNSPTNSPDGIVQERNNP
jgi:biopolymer transport protein ExbB/TolQ